MQKDVGFTSQTGQIFKSFKFKTGRPLWPQKMYEIQLDPVFAPYPCQKCVENNKAFGGTQHCYKGPFNSEKFAHDILYNILFLIDILVIHLSVSILNKNIK
jgi:hypothetical protein